MSSAKMRMILTEMGGMLMIVDSAGCIIFISHTVEKFMGYNQTELMGQSLYNLTCLEDYDELKRNLAPDEDQVINSTNSVTAVDESSSDSVCNSPAPRVTTSTPGQDRVDQRLRRSFYIRLRQRAQSRKDQPQYELVHVTGHLRMLSHVHTQRSESLPKHNDVILVAVVKPFREKMITTLSLMEPCREEFITRHTLDGHIIYADHRISIVTGYLPEEVCGVLGLHYMHKEDMRWAVIGLRQIFFQGSSCGWSCYRIQTKNGKFIYLKTCGYLELTENNDSFHSSASLICINSLVSPVEGEDMIRQMKDQYSPVIKTKSDRNMKIPTSNIQSATQAATGMPPLSIHIKKMGIVSTFIRTPEAVAVSLSPPSSHHSLPSGQCSHSPRTPPAPPPPPTLATPPPTPQNRPSVLRLTHCQGDQVRHGGRCIAKRR